MSSETPEQLAVADSGPLIALARIGRFDSSLIAALSILVDRGEAEAIALVQSRPGCLLLVDDAAARRVDERLQLRRTGTVGLLRLARKRGLIPLLGPELEKLNASGVYVRASLIRAVLDDVGE